MSAGWIIAAVCMTVLAIVDIREKAIPVTFLVAFGIMAVGYVLMEGEGEWRPVLYSLIPGVFLLAVSLCTRESIGYGDGWVVLALGLLTGAEGCFMAVFTGLLLSALFSLVLLAVHKVNGKSRLPFLPFLTIGLGVFVIAQNGFGNRF